MKSIANKSVRRRKTRKESLNKFYFYKTQNIKQKSYPSINYILEFIFYVDFIASHYMFILIFAK